MDASVLEVNRLLGEVTVKSPAAEHANSTIVKNVLTIERRHLVRSRGESHNRGVVDLRSKIKLWCAVLGGSWSVDSTWRAGVTVSPQFLLMNFIADAATTIYIKATCFFPVSCLFLFT